MQKSPLSLRSLAVFFLAFAVHAATAGSATWSGADTDWTLSGNWSPATVPGTGDTATFGAAGSPSVAPAGIALLNLNFDPAAQAYTFGGNISFDAGGSVNVAGGAAAQTLGAALTFTGNGSVVNNADPANVVAMSAGIALPLTAGATFTFDGAGSATLTTVNSGAGSGTVLTKIVKNGSGTVTLQNSNTGIGGAANGEGITINAGTLRITNANAASNRVINLNGGTLEGAAGNANSQYTRLHISADSRLFYSVNTNQWQLGNASTGVLVSTGTPTLTFDGTVTGTTATPIRLNMNTTAYTGTWALTSKAVVRLANTNTGGSGVVLDFGSGTGTHIVESLATFQDPATLSIKPIVMGALKSSATDAILRGRQNTGTQTTGTQYRFGSLGTDTTFAGIIADGTAVNGAADGTGGAQQTNGASGSQGTTEIVKEGAGTLTLTGANTYTGGTVITAGTLAISTDAALGAAYDGSLRPFSMIPGSGTFTALPTVTLSGGGGTGAALTLFSSTSQPTTANTYYVTFGNSALVNNVTGSGYTSPPTVTVNVAGTSPASKASVRVKGLLTIDGGTLRTNAAITSNRATVLSTGGTFDTNGFDSTLSGTVSGAGGLTKSGAGKLTIGNATHAGATSVNAGTLILNGSLSSSITVAPGAVLGGTAITSGSVTVDGTISPGSSAGAMGTGALTLAGASAYDFEISDWTGAAGTGFDTINAASLDITATSAAPVTVNVSELALTHFDGSSKTFVLVSTTGGITGYAADKFTVNSAGFTSGAGSWSVAVSGNSLLLNYTGSASPYEAWAAAAGLAGPDALKTADPDKDGITNLAEFAFNSSPAAGSNPGGPDSGGIKPVTGGDALTLTLRVRSGATFAGATALTATKDDVTYRIEGSTNLSTWTADIDEVTPALAAGLPAPDSGWEYRTFRIGATTTAQGRAQIRAVVQE